MLHIYTGNGKGKTTAALGLAVRAAGAGKRVGIIYFDKGGTSHYSERAVLAGPLRDSIVFEATGRDRIDPVSGRFDFSVTELDRQEAMRGLELARAWMRGGQFDVLVLDEINSCVGIGFLPLESVLALLDGWPSGVELVMTGRNAAPELLERADLVTEMQLHKHYYTSGVRAREGIDY